MLFLALLDLSDALITEFKGFEGFDAFTVFFGGVFKGLVRVLSFRAAELYSSDTADAERCEMRSVLWLNGYSDYCSRVSVKPLRSLASKPKISASIPHVHLTWPQ